MDNDARVKAEALKKIIFAILNGDKFPTLLMDIIRFVIPCAVSANSPFCHFLGSFP